MGNCTKPSMKDEMKVGRPIFDGLLSLQLYAFACFVEMFLYLSGFQCFGLKHTRDFGSLFLIFGGSIANNQRPSSLHQLSQLPDRDQWGHFRFFGNARQLKYLLL